VLLALVLAAATQGKPAQLPRSPLFADPDLAVALGKIEPRPGAWAEYLVRAKGNGGLRVRATALDAGESGRYWLELATAGEIGMASAARVLLRGRSSSPRDIERMYVMIAGQQPIEVPLDQIQLPEAGPRAKARVKRLGSGRVRVAAGEFAAELLRVSGTRVWRAANVPLWGLVKARSARQSVELVAFGESGGHSLFPPGWGQGNGSESRK
jgi:hypothetical protein